MLLGHYGIALAFKKAAPRTSLAILVMAANFLDLLWPIFLLFGWEKVSIIPGITVLSPFDFTFYPFSHSLLATIMWSAVFGGIYFAITKYRRGALAVAIAVTSHWILDALVHRPDLPLGLGKSTLIGLGLWNFPTITLILELGTLLVGAYFYVQFTTPRDRQGTYALVALLVTLLIIYAASLVGPPPPDTKMIAIVGNASWLFVLWSLWIDNHRQPRPPSSPNEALPR